MSGGAVHAAAATIAALNTSSTKELPYIELEEYNKCPSCGEIEYKVFMREKHLVECVQCGYVYPREIQEEK